MRKYILVPVALLSFTALGTSSNLNLPMLHSLAETDHSRPQYTLGTYYESQGNLAKAEEYYKQAAPREPDALMALAILYDKKGDQSLSLEYLDEARHQNHDIARLSYACLLIIQKEWQAAYDHLITLIDDEPYIETYYLLSYILLNTGYKDEGLKQLKQLKKLGYHFNTQAHYIAKFKEKVDEEIEANNPEALLFSHYC